MRPERNHGRGVFAALQCACLAIRSVIPVATDAQAVSETLQDLAALIAAHGHGHDTAAHDHSPAILNPGRWAAPAPGAGMIGPT